MEASSEDVESKPTVGEIEVRPEQIDPVLHAGPFFICDLCDKELAYKIAQDLLSGLATACVDSTTGVMFRTPASVAADVRKEMVDYLSVRSESFVAETVVLETDPGAEVSDHPLDILSSMIDDFALSKKSLFSRVSGLMLSEMREDRIDEFTQGMERDKFWLLDKRESVAQALIKNVDFKNLYHCNMKFASENEVIEHQQTCGYRPMMCENQGCNDTFSVDSLEHHDSLCPFRILPCEQHCSELLMRRDMDKHCITDCSMKLANCPFYSVGCQTPVPQCLVKKHSSENTHGHLLNVLQHIHKEASNEDVERWADQVEKSQFSDQLEARDVRTFTMAVKDIEKRIGPFVASPKKPETVEDTPAPPSEQATVAPAEEATTAPPTDQATKAPPSKERELPSPSPHQDTAPPTKERGLPSPSPHQDAAPPTKEHELPSPSPHQDTAPPTKERDLPSPSPHQDTAPPTKERDLPSLSPQQDTAPPSKERDLPSLTPKQDVAPSKERDLPSLTPKQDVAPSKERDLPSPSPKQDTVPPPTTTLPEQAVQTTAQTDTKTTQPHQDATSSSATRTTVQKETETTLPHQGTKTETTSSEQNPKPPQITTPVVESVKEVANAPPPEQPTANPSPPKDSATAGTDKAEPNPSPKQAPASPSQQLES